MHGVQRVGVYTLIAILAFALLFALMPVADRTSAQTGAKLQGVQLTLYPTRDPDAIWRFAAQDVSNDPVSNTTVLNEISDGKRMMREKDEMGQFTGREKLDATLSTDVLTINSQDDLITSTATITLVNECADIKLNSNEKRQVKIEQGFGFTAPMAYVDSPALKGTAEDLRMTFQFVIEEGSGKANLGWDPDSTEDCVDGKRITVKQ